MIDTLTTTNSQLPKHYNQRINSIDDYINRLFMLYSRLMVIRVDFSYNKQHSVYNSINRDVTRKHLERFLNNRRGNSKFNDLVGYIISLEHGNTRGWHYHAILLFNGANVCKDGYYSKEMGEYWMNVVSSFHPDEDYIDGTGYGIRRLGSYFDCNLNKVAYNRCGIGQIDHGDVEKRQIFMGDVASYLAKDSQNIEHSVLEPNQRYFWRGTMPTIPVERMGRPRQIEI